MPEEQTMGAPLPAKKGLFSSKPAQQAPDIGGMTDQLNMMAARLRVNEERYSELRKKLLLIESNMLSNHKKAITEVKALQSDLLEFKRTMQNVEDRIITIIKELRLTARKEDMDVMKRYIELWNPTRFVSHDQVQKIIQETLAPKELSQKPNYDSPS